MKNKIRKWLMNDIASLEIMPSKIRIAILNKCGADINNTLLILM